MASYLDWAMGKLEGAPAAGACAFWIDPHHLLASRNGGRLEDAQTQPLLEAAGREWTVVAYRANFLPARHLLTKGDTRVVVWAMGEQNADAVDLTPFEDCLGKAHSVVEISLDAVVRELRPELNLPKDLSEALRGISFDVDNYVDFLAEEGQQRVLTTANAANSLVKLLLGRERGIECANPQTIIATTALCYAAARNDNHLKAVRLAVDCTSAIDSRYGALLAALARCDPRDAVAAACVGSGLARLRVENIGAIMAAEGFCPAELRVSFEAAGGRWSELARLFGSQELKLLASSFERLADPATLPRLRELTAGSHIDLALATQEPLSMLRLAAVLGHFEEFIRGSWSATNAPLIEDNCQDELIAADAVACGVRTGGEAAACDPSALNNVERMAEAFAASPLSIADLDIAMGLSAFGQIEDVLSAATAELTLKALRTAQSEADEELDVWNQRWASLISGDVEGFRQHERQGWRRVESLAPSSHTFQTWLVIFDGLRYDLWKKILAPALEHEGWRVPETDVSFAYLPSTTAIARHRLVGGAFAASASSEAGAAKALAENWGIPSTYVTRSERMERRKEEAKQWNVRVFSWPDKFAHLDTADLGTLAHQFQVWVQDEFFPWFRNNVSRNARVAVSTDHGLATLRPEDAIDVNAADEGDRDTPRVLRGAHPEVGESGIVVAEAGQSFTVASSRRWFRSPSGRHWPFAHGGCTLHEAVVPFAGLVAVRADVAEIGISGLPQSLSITEGEEASLAFSIKVTGGSELFFTVDIRSNLGQLRRQQMPIGTESRIDLPVKGAEGLTRIIVTVTCGLARREEQVETRVELKKIQRTTLDLDL